MEDKQKYVCSFCGAEYDSAPARARCELACDAKTKHEAEQRRRDELCKRQSERAGTVKEKYNDFMNAVKEYSADYDVTDLIPIMRSPRTELFPISLFWW